MKLTKFEQICEEALNDFGISDQELEKYMTTPDLEFIGDPVSDGNGNLYQKVKAKEGEDRCKKCAFFNRDPEGNAECTALTQWADDCEEGNFYYIFSSEEPKE